MCTCANYAGSVLTVEVFLAGDQHFTARDILDAAWFRGESQPLWREFLIGHAGTLGAADRVPSDEAIQSLSEEIRYHHELITSEETERWLSAHRLSLDDLTDSCHRRYWSTHGASHSVASGSDYAEAAPDLRELFLKDLFLTGKFDGLAQAWAWRIAAWNAKGLAATAAADGRETQRRQFFQRTGLAPDKLPEMLRGLAREQLWFEEQLQTEAGYAEQVEGVCMRENRARSLATLRLQLTRLEVELMDLESEGAVREACFCLESDGLTMAELAEQEHYRVERKEFLLEEFSDEQRMRFLGTEVGQVRPLITEGEHFQVCRVLAKHEPLLTDASVVARVDEELIGGHFNDLVSKHIVWLLTPDAPS